MVAVVAVIFNIVITMILALIFGPRGTLALGSNTGRLLVRTVSVVIASIITAHVVAAFVAIRTDSAWAFLSYPALDAFSLLAVRRLQRTQDSPL